MQANIETLDGLQRRVDLTLSAQALEKEVGTRLAKLARGMKMPGFRPGKVPMKMVAASYGAQVHSEVLNDQIGAAFNEAVGAGKLRVAGTPRVEPKTGAADGELAFSATFEVFPEIDLGDIGAAEVQRAVCEVGEAEVDATIEIMRKQRTRYEAVERAAQAGDRVTVDFTGTLDGTPFDGGSAKDMHILVGEGRMLPEFEAALPGMTAAQSKTFPLTFPADYRATHLAGKTVQFEVTVKQVEAAVLPAVDADFAKALGVVDGDLATMRAEVRANLEREVRSRLQGRTKDSVMNALLGLARFDVPKSLVEAETARMAEAARSDLVARGINAKEAPLPPEVFAAGAERRVRLGLVLSELVQKERLQAQQQQIRRAIEELAQSYEQPQQVIQWYLGDRQRVAEIENMVIEENVVDWVLSRARVVDTPVAFDELMGRTGTRA
jgi:trigger factor